MQLESYRSTSGPLEFRLPVFSTLVSTRHLKKSADSIRARARSGMALRRQHPRKGPRRRVQSSIAQFPALDPVDVFLHRPFVHVEVGVNRINTYNLSQYR